MKKRILRLHLKAKYWHEIKAGTKKFEYRLANDYWESRLRGAPYDEVHVLLGYPKNGDESRLMRFKWVGWPEQKSIVHPEWDNKPVRVYAIDVSQPLIRGSGRMTQWFKTIDAKPEFPFGKSHVYVQAWTSRGSLKEVHPLVYRQHRSAKTQKGRLPRFEHLSGPISVVPEYWAYMGVPPALPEAGEEA